MAALPNAEPINGVATTAMNGHATPRVSDLDGKAPAPSDWANYFCTYAFLYHQVSSSVFPYGTCLSAVTTESSCVHASLYHRVTSPLGLKESCSGCFHPSTSWRLGSRQSTL